MGYIFGHGGSIQSSLGCSHPFHCGDLSWMPVLWLGLFAYSSFYSSSGGCVLVNAFFVKTKTPTKRTKTPESHNL
jgi:hypothetical protein